MRPVSDALAAILERARWAPSGDNTQPWRIEIVDDHHLIVHASDTREHCVYDLDGHPSQIAQGTLLETIAIAASAHGFETAITRAPDSPDTQPDYHVELTPDAGILPSPLLPFIETRSVQRRPMRITALTSAQKMELEAAVPAGYTIQWWEGNVQRGRWAKLMFDNARLRLTLPEAYLVHRNIIEWNARFSVDKVPDQSLGLDTLTLRLMRWVMHSWQRVAFFNRYLAGHVTPRIEMDLVPGWFCAAHFAIVADRAPSGTADYVATGRALQRFWLTATRLGLQLQPEMTPLIFSRYVRDARKFSDLPSAMNTAKNLSRRLTTLMQIADPARAVFLGRIGSGRKAHSRSLRLSVEKLRTE